MKLADTKKRASSEIGEYACVALFMLVAIFIAIFFIGAIRRVWMWALFGMVCE